MNTGDLRGQKRCLPPRIGIIGSFEPPTMDAGILPLFLLFPPHQKLNSVSAPRISAYHLVQKQKQRNSAEMMAGLSQKVVQSPTIAFFLNKAASLSSHMRDHRGRRPYSPA